MFLCSYYYAINNKKEGFMSNNDKTVIEAVKGVKVSTVQKFFMNLFRLAGLVIMIFGLALIIFETKSWVAGLIFASIGALEFFGGLVSNFIFKDRT